MITPGLRALVIADLNIRAKKQLYAARGLGSEEEHLEFLVMWLYERMFEPSAPCPPDSVGTQG